MKILHVVGAGLAGAVVLTVTHQLLHKFFADAPRMDLMGEEAITKIADKTNMDIPEKNLYTVTMASDIVANTLYYTLAALGKSKAATLRGGLLGLIAGIGGVVLPKHLRLHNAYSNRTLTTRLMTTAIYTLGGLVSGKVLKVLSTK